MINVGNPNLKRSRPHLERNACNNQNNTRPKQKIVWIFIHQISQVLKRQRIHALVTGIACPPRLGVGSDTIEKNDSQEEKRRAQGPEHEIFDPGLEGLGCIAVVSDKDVKADGDRFQGHEEHEKVAALAKKHQSCSSQHR